MAIYYVRPDGNDSNTGTGSGTGQAWQTLQKALGATSGLVGGDIVYVAPGRYVELVTVGITSPSSQVRIVGDPNVTQFSGLSAGVVRHTNMTANGTNIGRVFLSATSKNNLSFENIYFESNENVGSGTDRIIFTTSQGWQFKKCVFDDISTDGNHRMLACTATTSTPFNGVIDSCIFIGGARQIRLDGQNVADTTVIKNCIFTGAIQTGVSASNLQFAMYNCSFFDMSVSPVSADAAGSIAQTIKNCLFYRTSSLYWSTNNGVSYTYNRSIAAGAPINVTVGATNSSVGSHGIEVGYNLLHNIQAIWRTGTTLNSPNTSFGDATSAPTTDLFNVAWSGASPDAGAITYRNLQTITPIYQPTERNASTIRIAPGSTSQSIELYLGATGLTASTAGLSARYNRTRTASVNIPLVARTIGQAWISGGFAEVDSVYMPGVYRLDLPDAALAAAADDVTVVVRGASGTNGAVMTVTLSTGDNTGAGDVSGNILEITEDPQEVTNISAWTGDWHTYVMRLVDDNGTPYDTTNDTLSVTYTNVATGSAYSFGSGSATITKQLNGQGIISLLNPAAYPTAAVIRITIGAAIGSTVRRFGPLEVEVLAP